MGLRDRHHERHGGAVRYQMREKLLAIGDDSWVEDAAGQRVFKVNGKAARLRDTFVLEDASGREVAKIKERALHVRDTMTIDLGGRSATVKKALVGLRARFHVDVDGAPDLKAHGNIVDHEYEIEANGQKVAEVSKRWLRVADSYGVQVAPGQNAVLMLAIAAILDEMAHPDR